MVRLMPALAARRARRAFDPRPVPPEVQQVLWEAVSVAPSHGNSQATRILLAQSAEARAKLVAALGDGNRSWAPAAPILLAIASLPLHEGRPKDRDGSEREMWAFNSGVATGNLLAQATEFGLVAHPMAGFDELAAREAFEAPESVRILVVVAIGYPGDAGALSPQLQEREQAPQERLPLSVLVANDRWTEENGTSYREYRERATRRGG